MGMIWKNTMPLLSTLAALVIIVHSAEEEMDYHHDLSSRLAEPGAPNHEQNWRAIRSEPMMQKTLQGDNWDDSSPEEAPRRHRLGRKRKRRPLAALSKEPEERKFYHEDAEPHHDTQYPKSPEVADSPRRRKKRPEIDGNSWVEQPSDQQRPLRRRGLRRKRPKTSNFEVFKNDDHMFHVSDESYRNDQNERDHEDKLNDNLSKHEKEEEQTNDDYKAPYEDKQYEEKFLDTDFDLPKAETSAEPISLDENSPQDENGPITLNTDKSSSESSSDSENPTFKTIYNDNTKNTEKQNTLFDFRTIKDRPIDHQTLKEILKKSNGSSLSEILQQNNLSLSDLLRGKENAISVLQTNNRTEAINQGNLVPKKPDTDIQAKVITDSPLLTGTPETDLQSKNSFDNKVNKQNDTEVLDTKEDAPKIAHRRRLFPGGRRKLRLRPPMKNITVKYQSSKDFMTAYSRKKMQRNNGQILNETENTAVEIYTSEPSKNVSIQSTTISIATTLSEEATTQYIDPERNINVSNKFKPNIPTEEVKTDDDHKATTPLTTSTSNEVATEAPELMTTTTTMEKLYTPIVRAPIINNAELRRQALSNRLKKKRLRQKISTTASPQNDLTKDLFGMANLVSASEFIAKVHNGITKSPEEDTALEDFMATEASTRLENGITPQSSITKTYFTTKTPMMTTTEEIARYEIEEILKDDDSGSRLSKILMERNMSLSELVKHRERGSSQVHLADIFHNTSREPNPPEPFLSKSLLEPISKETYPLRALLDANSHDPTTKPTTIESSQIYMHQSTIPVVMDYKSNVNENSENLGIVSLFNNMTKNFDEKPVINKDSEGTPYISSVVSVNISNSTDNSREGRDLNNAHNMVTLNEIFAMMERTYRNSSHEISEKFAKVIEPTNTTVQASLEEDVDGDGLIVLEDLQHLKDFDSSIASATDEKIDIRMNESQESSSIGLGILDKTQNNTKSVTIITASIAGLTMVVFLLTYAAFKWRQQSSIIHKKDSFCEERIPTPVFESRKGNRTHSSTRSISPMLSSTNIYTMSTLDSSNGKESPDYMWDSLRKPFQ